MKIDFYMPVKIFSGSGAFVENAFELKRLGLRCLVVTGGTSALKSGALEDIRNSFERLGIEYKVFDAVEQNPYTKTCMEAGQSAAAFGADFILGVGGGSPLDAAKAAAIYACNPSFSHADIYDREAGCPRLPVALIGTTAGTGSEVTAVSVLTNSDNGQKKSINGPDCFADIAFCDARYSFSMPYSVSVSTALDAFAHAVESFFSLNANEMSRLYAQRAIPAIWKALKYFYNKTALPDEKMREELYFASVFAGFSICVTGTLFPHTLGYILSEDFGIAHGKACTAFMPVLIERGVKHEPEKADLLFELCGTDYAGFVSVIKALTDVNIDISGAEIEKYCARWSNKTKNFESAPGGFTVEDAAAALSRLANL